MKKVLIGVGIVIIAALAFIFGEPVKIGQMPPTFGDTEDMSSVESLSSMSESSIAETKTVILVDQSFESVIGTRGAAKLKAMRVQKIAGNVKNASIHFTLSRNGQNEGIAGVMMYAAQLDEVGNIIPATEWSRFRAVDASWLGDGRCQLAPSDSGLVSGKGETVEMGYSFSAVPVSDVQPECMAGGEQIDLEGMLYGGGIALGFLPTNEGYHLTVTLTYEGDLTIKPW
jgi:hypothetical protein